MYVMYVCVYSHKRVCMFVCMFYAYMYILKDVCMFFVCMYLCVCIIKHNYKCYVYNYVQEIICF